jgi:hypothetical protein
MQQGEQEQPAPPTPIPPSVLGISEWRTPELIGKAYVPTNSWAGYVDAVPLIVMAGSEKADPRQGILYVAKFYDVTGSRHYSTPTATGPVKIVGASNGILTLASFATTTKAFEPYSENWLGPVKTRGGQIYYFNLRTRKFE